MRHVVRVAKLRRFCQHWISGLLSIIATAAVLILWQQLVLQEQCHIQELVQQETNTIKLAVEQAVSDHISALERMAYRWQVSQGTPRSLWEADAAEYIKDPQRYQSIEWVDSDWRGQWAVPDTKFKDLTANQKLLSALQQAREQRRTVLTPTLPLSSGQGFLACLPLFIAPKLPPAAERFDGWIVGAFQYESLLNPILGTSLQYQVQIYEGAQLVYSSLPEAPPVTSAEPFNQASLIAPPQLSKTIKASTLTIQLDDVNWRIQVSPTAALIEAARSPLPTVLLGGGLLSAWTMGVVVYLGQRSTHYAQQARVINQQLQAEIAERQKIEANLRLSEERWQLALRGTNDGIWDWNVQTNEVFFSSRWKAMLGFTDSEISHQLEEWLQRIHPDDSNRTLAAIQAHFAQQTRFYVSEYRLRCKNGSYQWILDRGQAVWNAEGQVVRMTGSHANITARKRAEVALKESERKYRQLIHHINAGYIVHAPDTRILQCNPTACQLLGLSIEQMLGKTAIDPAWHFVREDGSVMPVAEYPVNIVLSTQAPLRNYVLGICQGREPQVWVLVTALPEFDNHQHIKQIVVTCIDISQQQAALRQQKQAEAALQNSQMRFAGILEIASDAIISVNIEQKITLFNQGAERIFGYSAEEMLGEPLALLIPHQYVPVHSQQTRRDFQTPEQKRSMLQREILLGRRKDGSEFPAEASISQLNLNGEIIFTTFLRDITDRQQAEQALRESEARFQAFMNHSPTAAWITDINGVMLYASQTYRRTFQPLADPVGRRLFDLYPAEIAQKFLTKIQTVVQSQEVLQTVEILPYPDGTPGNFLIYEFPIPDSSGRLLVGGVAIDVTQQHRAEAALRHSEATKQAIIQAIPDLLIRMCSDGQYIEFIANTRFNIVNPGQERQNLNVRDVLVPELADLRLHYTQLALQSGVVQVYEQEIFVEHNRRYEEVRIVPLLPNEVLVMIRDITARNQAEEDLRHQKEMFQAIIDYIPVMIALFDAQGQVEFVNPELEQVLGWSIQAWQQGNILAACYPDSSYRQTVLDHMLAAAGQWQDFTTLTARGQSLETSWANIQLSDGRFLGIGQDITDRKRKENVLQQAMEAAEAANRAKSIFLANMSHELRTPLNVILGFTQVMAHDPTLTAAQQADLQTIQRSGDHLLNLINDVLDLSKIEAGRYTLTESSFDLISLLHTLQSMMTERAQAKQLRLSFEIAPDLPQFVIADEQKLRQILLNLLSNAIKFTDRGCVTLRARPDSGAVSQSPTSLWLQFDVVDTGIGIAAADQDSIFNAFVQAASCKSTGGTGLGLTISRKLLALMKGNMTVNSDLGIGSTFTVTVPVDSTHEIDQRQPVDRLVVGLAPPQLRHRILVVDDQLENRLTVVRLLSQIGLDLKEASSGEEAIQLWQQWRPDLIWMDIRLPGINGYEATQQIRALETEPTSIIIALTAQASPIDRDLALAAGCNDYLSKPFRAETLFLKLQEYLGLQYVYAESAQPEVESKIQQFKPLLTTLSPEWLAALENAAICGNDRAIVQLVDQLPSHLATLGTEVIELAKNYQFEPILQLIHPSFT